MTAGHDDRNGGGEALIRYGDAEFQVLRPGAFVICAVTGRQIPIDQLRYWSVDRQEPYIDSEAASRRWRELSGVGV